LQVIATQLMHPYAGFGFIMLSLLNSRSIRLTTYYAYRLGE